MLILVKSTGKIMPLVMPICLLVVVLDYDILSCPMREFVTVLDAADENTFAMYFGLKSTFLTLFRKSDEAQYDKNIFSTIFSDVFYRLGEQ